MPSSEDAFGETRAQEDLMQKMSFCREEAADRDASKAQKFPFAHARRSSGFAVEIDGEFASQYGTLMEALKAGFELRRKFPNSRIGLHEVNEQMQYVGKSD